MEIRSIEGLWHSYYEYGQGTEDLPRTSEDKMQFSPTSVGCMGVSLPNDEGSKITVWLDQKNKIFSGSWKVQTAPGGHYQGRTFKGSLMLVLQDPDTLDGQWLGPNSTNDRIKSGRWIFKRVLEDADENIE